MLRELRRLVVILLKAGPASSVSDLTLRRFDWLNFANKPWPFSIACRPARRQQRWQGHTAVLLPPADDAVGAYLDVVQSSLRLALRDGLAREAARVDLGTEHAREDAEQRWVVLTRRDERGLGDVAVLVLVSDGTSRSVVQSPTCTRTCLTLWQPTPTPRHGSTTYTVALDQLRHVFTIRLWSPTTLRTHEQEAHHLV